MKIHRCVPNYSNEIGFQIHCALSSIDSQKTQELLGILRRRTTDILPNFLIVFLQIMPIFK